MLILVKYLTTARSVQEMFGSIAPRYDIANTILSGGVHHYWRRFFVGLIPRGDQRVILDLCTGTGALLPLLARRGGTVLGSDFCFPMLKNAPEVNRGRLLQGDALHLPFADHSVDVITVAFGVRNLEDVTAGLREMRRVLKPDGRLLVLEFGQPRGLMAPLFGWYSKHIMPRLGGVLTGDRAAYTYLPETSRRFPCREEFVSLACNAGYSGGKFHSLTGGICYAYELNA